MNICILIYALEMSKSLLSVGAGRKNKKTTRSRCFYDIMRDHLGMFSCKIPGATNIQWFFENNSTNIVSQRHSEL